MFYLFIFYLFCSSGLHGEVDQTVTSVDVDFETVRVGLANGSITYLDVRTWEEIQTNGRIVGSFVIPLNELEEAFNRDEKDFASRYGFDKPSKKGSNLVLGCRSGVRALKAFKILDRMGYESLRVYKGSFEEWEEKGGPIKLKA